MIVLQLGDPAVLVGEVAEHDRLGRAGVLAGRRDLAVDEVAALVLGLDLLVLDALHAVRALLHHAAVADRHLGVHHQLADPVARLLELLVPVEEVEAADAVRAVVQAVAGADAAVVGHVVQALARVLGRGDRAHLLAGRVLALLAGDRLVDDVGIVGRALEVAVDADPVHLAVAGDLGPADDGDVVLRLAGDHARVAADARAEVDRHAPAVTLVGPLLEQRVVAAVRILPELRFGTRVPLLALGAAAIRGRVDLLDELGQALLGAAVADVEAEQLLVEAGVDVPVLLHAGEVVAVAARGHLRAGRDVERLGRAQLVRVEADGLVRAGAALRAGLGATAAEDEPDRAHRLAGHHVGGDVERILHAVDL